MDPEEMFKKFFGFSNAPEFGPRGFSHGDGRGEGFSGGDMFSHMHRQMEEMEKHMQDVFRVFTIPDMPSYQIEKGHDPRNSMLKERGEEGHAGPDSSLFSPSSPRDFVDPPTSHGTPGGGLFSNWFGIVPAIPQWDRIHPQDRTDTEIFENDVSDREIADLLDPKKKQEPFVGQPKSHSPFSFHGSSVKIQTVVGMDGKVEERRTTRDSSGREQTTVTRRIGDSQHTVTTTKDDKGGEERHETFTNLDEDKMPEFDQQWSTKKSEQSGVMLIDPDTALEDPSKRGGMLSDNWKGIFQTFFGS